MSASALYLLVAAGLGPCVLATPTASNLDQVPKDLFVPMSGYNDYPFKLTDINPYLSDFDPGVNWVTFFWRQTEGEKQDLQLQFPKGATIMGDGYRLAGPEVDAQSLTFTERGWEAMGAMPIGDKHLDPPDESLLIDRLMIVADGIPFLLEGWSKTKGLRYTPTPDGPVVTFNIEGEKERKFIFYIGAGVPEVSAARRFLNLPDEEA